MATADLDAPLVAVLALLDGDADASRPRRWVRCGPTRRPSSGRASPPA
ncbi:MAG: hypothetical protein R2755_05370 [Acidimicrobiales bacterium]